MKAYSEDLRERVIRAVEAGRPREAVATRFEVSVPTIERWVRLKRDTGGLARRPVPGPAAVKTVGLLAALPGRLAEHADATLEEHCSWWRGVSGFEVSTATMSRALARLGWTRKKRR
jgi:transposase